MKWSGFRSLLLVVVVAAALAGCGTNQGISTTPTPVLITDTFTGQLTPSGGTSYTFTAKSGQVTVKLTSLSPDLTGKLTMTISTYSAYYGCGNPVMGSDTTGVGTQLIGLATATTSLCVSISDPASVIPTGSGESFTITAVHY